MTHRGEPVIELTPFPSWETWCCLTSHFDANLLARTLILFGVGC